MHSISKASKALLWSKGLKEKDNKLYLIIKRKLNTLSNMFHENSFIYNSCRDIKLIIT